MEENMFIIQVSIPTIVGDLVEPFIFNNVYEATQFRDYLRDLYGLNVDFGYTSFDTFDTAIQRMEVFGPSEE